MGCGFAYLARSRRASRLHHMGDELRSPSARVRIPSPCGCGLTWPKGGCQGQTMDWAPAFRALTMASKNTSGYRQDPPKTPGKERVPVVHRWRKQGQQALEPSPPHGKGRMNATERIAPPAAERAGGKGEDREQSRAWVPVRRGWKGTTAKGDDGRTTVTRHPADRAPSHPHTSGLIVVPEAESRCAPVQTSDASTQVVEVAAVAIQTDGVILAAGTQTDAEPEPPLPPPESRVEVEVAAVEWEEVGDVEDEVELLLHHASHVQVLVTTGPVVPHCSLRRVYHVGGTVRGGHQGAAVMRYRNSRPCRDPILWEVGTLSVARYAVGDYLFQRVGAKDVVQQPLSEWTAVVGDHWACGEATYELGSVQRVPDGDGGVFIVRRISGFADPHGVAGLMVMVADIMDNLLSIGCEHVAVVVGPLPHAERAMAALGTSAEAQIAKYMSVQAQCSREAYPIFTTYMNRALADPSTAPDPALLRMRIEEMVREAQLSQQAAP